MVDEITADLLRRKNEPLLAGDLVRALRAVGQLVESSRDDRQFIEALQARLLIVDELPAEAPLGALIRRRTGTLGERATLYMGNGAGQPITKLPVPTAV